LGSGKPRWLVSVVSNLAKVTYTWATSSLLLILKTSLKITKRKSEFIYRGRTENKMARRQRTKNGLHKSSPKSALSLLEKLSFVLFLLAIVLSVFHRYTDSDEPFGIFKLFSVLCIIYKVYLLTLSHSIIKSIYSNDWVVHFY
jgi:hypothetical protein